MANIPHRRDTIPNIDATTTRPTRRPLTVYILQSCRHEHNAMPAQCATKRPECKIDAFYIVKCQSCASSTSALVEFAHWFTLPIRSDCRQHAAIRHQFCRPPVPLPSATAAQVTLGGRAGVDAERRLAWYCSCRLWEIGEAAVACEGAE